MVLPADFIDRIICGNVLDVLKTIPNESIHCCVTSPPYWGLRAYGTEPQVWLNGKETCVEHQWYPVISTVGRKDAERKWKGTETQRVQNDTCFICGAWRGELGLEPTPELYIEHLVQIFREVRRVLRSDGTLWLNLGDSYASSGGAGGWLKDRNGAIDNPNRRIIGLKPKDLVGIPWRTALALQSDGWFLRSDIIWSKPNPMPESVRDRPTKSHEYIFLLTKSADYFYDYTAILESANYDGRKDTFFKGSDKYQNGFAPTGTNPQTMFKKGHERWPSKTHKSENIGGQKQRLARNHHGGYLNEDGAENFHRGSDGTPARNKRSVWIVTTKPFRNAHFATFPPDLIEPMILSGTSEYGACSQCGAPYIRQIEKDKPNEEWKRACGADSNGRATHFVDANGNKHTNHSVGASKIDLGARILAGMKEKKTVGREPPCGCNAEIIPAVVLDPFMGSGTTGMVAKKHGRNYLGIELKEQYIRMAARRIRQTQVKLPFT